MQNLETRPVQMEEEDLIQRTLSGDQEAFGELIQTYKDSLFDMAYRILGNRADAEDILQDAFLTAYRHLSEFQHQARFSTWMYTIVLNRVRNHLRHQKVIRWRSLDGRRFRHEDERPPEVPDKGPSIQTLAENKLELEALRKEVARLPALYQSMFILHYFQGMPLDDVARRLNRPIGTVKVYLHRGRKLLYKRLALRSSSLG